MVKERSVIVKVPLDVLEYVKKKQGCDETQALDIIRQMSEASVAQMPAVLTMVEKQMEQGNAAVSFNLPAMPKEEKKE